MQPKLTIIFLNKEYDAHLEQCLDCIQNQNYDNFNIIMCGSPLCKERMTFRFGGLTNRMLFAKNEDKDTASRHLNSAIKVVEDDCKFVAFVTSENFLNSNYLSSCVSMFEKDTEYIGAVYTDYTTNARKHLQSFCRKVLTSAHYPPLTSVIRTDILAKAGLFDTKMILYYEWDYWMRVTELAVSYHIPESLYLSTEEELPYPQEKLREYVVTKAMKRIQNGK